MALVTAKEEAEIAGYTKILEFRDLVLVGKHPRVKLQLEDLNSTSKPTTPTTEHTSTIPPAPITYKIPVYLGTSQQPTTSNSSSLTLPSHPAKVHTPTSIIHKGLTIDFTQNYYRDLGVQPHVLRGAIESGFKHYSASYSPFSKRAKQKWMSSESRIRKKVSANWYRIQHAYQVLVDPELRRLYDDGRIV